MFDYVRFGFSLGKVGPTTDENVVEDADEFAAAAAAANKSPLSASQSLPVPRYPDRSRTPSPMTSSTAVDRPEIKLDTPTENLTEIPLSKV